MPVLVLGGGSNLLVADAGFAGLVLRVEIDGIEWSDDGDAMTADAGAGVEWDQLVARSVERGLQGIECLSGIPGSVGGTPVQNVGAYGQEISETLQHVRVYDRAADRIREMDRSECGFEYRSSVFNSVSRDRYIVLRVACRLRRNAPPHLGYPDVQRETAQLARPSLSDVREAVRRIRARKGMLITAGDPDSRSAGSFFRNPVVSPEEFARVESEASRSGVLKAEEIVPRYKASGDKIKLSAAWLIERAGIPKGYSRGAAAVSMKHTLALINKSNARADDIIALAREIRSRVEDRFGVRLVPEPVLVGFDEPVVREFRP